MLNFSQVKKFWLSLGYINYERQVIYMPKRYKKPSVPRNKRVYNEKDNTIIDTGIPNLNGVREYTQPVHNAIDKTSVCKYCSKSIVRGYICYDCRDLERPVKKQSIEDRLAIEEGLRILKDIRIQEAIQRQQDLEAGSTTPSPEEIAYNYCRGCGMQIPTSVYVKNYKRKCDFCS